MFRKFLIAFPLILVAVTSNTPPVEARETIVCESVNGRTNRCRIETRNGVELIRRLSRESCDGNWRIGDDYVEVRNNCRAEFASDDRYTNNNSWDNSNRQTVVCESINNRTNRCGIDTRNGVRLVKRLSRQSCDGNWREGDGYVEVRNGCQAQFASNSGSSGNNNGWNNNSNQRSVVCESNDGRDNRCSIDTRNGVQLVEQLSSTSCFNNWRIGNGYVEVRNGCRGRFASGGSSSNWSNPNRQSVICESNDGRSNRCRIDTRYGIRLEEQLSSASCFNNWRVGDNYVEVRNGCRGRFSSN